MQQIQQPPQMINLKDAETVKCEKCQGEYFKEVFYLKKVSKFSHPSLVDDQIVPYAVHKCDSCGHINEGFNPFEEKKQVISE